MPWKQAMKTYQLCQAASWVAENKFRAIEGQKCKFEETYPKKIGSRKHRFMHKEFEKVLVALGKFFRLEIDKFRNKESSTNSSWRRWSSKMNIYFVLMLQIRLCTNILRMIYRIYWM